MINTYLTELPIASTYVSTTRSLNINSIENLHLNKEVLDKLSDLLSEVLIRFDTNPKCYLKEDYKKLIDLLNKLTSVLIDLLNLTESINAIVDNINLLIDNLEDSIATTSADLLRLKDDINLSNSSIIKYTASSKYTPYKLETLPIIISNVFYEGKGIITFAEEITEIGFRAFYNSRNLMSLILPESTKTIGQSAFNSDTELTSVHIPDSVTLIKDSAFNSCPKLTKIILPANLTDIEFNAFLYDSSLKLIVSKAEIPPVLGDNVFNGVDKSIPLYVPIPDNYREAPGWNDFSNIQPLEVFNNPN